MKKQFSIIFLAMLMALSAAVAQSPTMNQLTGIGVNPQHHYARMKDFQNVRNFHLWADDISLGGGGRQRLPF